MAEKRCVDCEWTIGVYFPGRAFPRREKVNKVKPRSVYAWFSQLTMASMSNETWKLNISTWILCSTKNQQQFACPASESRTLALEWGWWGWFLLKTFLWGSGRGSVNWPLIQSQGSHLGQERRSWAQFFIVLSHQDTTSTPQLAPLPENSRKELHIRSMEIPNIFI